MAYTTPRTWVSGEYPTAAQFNANMRDNVSFLANAPTCRVSNNASQSPATATLTVLTFNTERWDNAAMHDTSTNTHRITAPTAGVYIVTGSVQFASNATGFRGLFVYLNTTVSGVTVTAGTRIASEFLAANNGDFTELSISTMYKVAANDHFSLVVYQTSGSGLAVNSAANFSPEFGAAWVGLG